MEKVDLVAENERVGEENRVRSEAETQRAKMIEMRREKAKQDIINRALSEESDLERERPGGGSGGWSEGAPSRALA